jgi:hypothetical protein
MKVYKGFFSTREEVLEDLKRTGHWPTTYVSEPSPELPLHSHDLDVTGYVISGGTYVLDGDGTRHDLEPGDKLELPAGSVHAEGAVTRRTTYIVGTATAGQFFEQFQMRDPEDPAKILSPPS